MMRYLVGFLLALALGVIGCSETSGTGGTAGAGGNGGGGDGGFGGDGGTGGATGQEFPCTEQGIRDAIAEGGGPHTFDCEGPSTVVAKTLIEIDNDVILDGEGKLTVDGSGITASWWLSVLEGVTATLDGFAVTGGESLGEFGDGIYNLGTLTLTNSTVYGSTAEQGGGIYNLGTLTLTNSTVSGNTAEFFGGGILNMGMLTLTNSTVSDNTAEFFGGGIYNSGMLTLTNSTVSDNTSTGADGVDNEGTATLTAALVNDDCSGLITSNGYNIESPGDTCGFDQSTDRVNVTAEELNLGPLADNGGTTMTHALLTEPDISVAIDAIPEADCADVDGAPLTADQRGDPRPVAIIGPEPKCDVGAFEL